MPDPLYPALLEAYDGAIKRFAIDLGELTHDELNRSYGESCRKAYDFVYEVSTLHRRAAKELNGEPTPFPWKMGEEWPQAPAEMCDKQAASEFFRVTAQELHAAFEAHRDEPLCASDGPTALYKNLRFGVGHCSYHDAQLNFIQAMRGDMAVHW